MIDKATHRKFRRAVDEILWKDWDPIGLNQHADWPDDEYSAYAGAVCGMVWKGEGEQVIADYLYKVESEHMGLGGAASTLVPRNIQLARRILKTFKDL